MIPTKTLVPQRLPHLLPRPRLVDRLHRNVDRALILVCAPAGYGKTSLLVDFVDDAPFPLCWLSLDAADRDLHNFLEYLVAALRRRFPDFGAATERALAINPNLRHNPTALSGIIVQDMIDHIPDFFALVLDDYHVIDESDEVTALLSALLTYRPEHFHLILSSRIEPGGLPIIQLTARSQVAGVGPAHLAFTAPEIQAFMKQTHNVPLSLSQAEELVAESEGWITAILLSTEAMWRGMRETLARANRLSAEAGEKPQGPIYAYLAEQVFAEQSTELKEFLLVSSTLQEMNGTLCREVLGLTDVIDTLREIERRGVFMTTVIDDATGTWYRYHHLFHDFLQTRLRTRDSARFRRLHHHAADWFEDKERWERAVDHRLRALSVSTAPEEDARAAARTMDGGLTPLFYASKMETLIAWYEAIPQALQPEFPRLLLFAGRALVNLGQNDRALPLLRRAEAIFEENGATEQALFAALQQANIWYLRGQYVDALELAQRVLKQTDDYPAPAAEAFRLAGLACLNLGRPAEALSHQQAALALSRELQWVPQTAMAYTELALVHSRLGQLSESRTYQDKAIELYRQLGPSDQLAILLNNVAYQRYYLTGDYAAAERYLDEALEVAQISGAARAQTFALLTRADLYRDLGALEPAMALYAQAEEIARQLDNANLVCFTLNGIAQAQLLVGNTVDALGLVTQVRDQAERRQDVYQLGLSCLTLGAARLQSGDVAAALLEIERGRDLLEQGGARRALTRAYMLLARARQVAEDQEGALAALNQALEIGLETQTPHHLVIEGQQVFELWKEMLRRNPADRRPAQIMDRIRALPDVARKVVGGLASTALPRSPTLRFFGFGPGSITKDGKPIPTAAWRSALARHLLFYLLVHPPQKRDQITATFWPDLSQDKAKSSFHAVKYQAHRALERQLIVYEEGRYQIEWDPDCWFDVRAFESLLQGRDGRQTRLERAVSLYQGDFLEGYDAAWCESVRKQWRLRFRDALVELGELYTRAGEFAQAFGVLGRALDVDDLYEPANRALMRVYAYDGRGHAAVEHYHRLEAELQEIGTVPAPETQALYEQIRSGNFPPQP